MSASLPTMKSFDNFKSAVGRLSLTLNPVSSNPFMKHINPRTARGGRTDPPLRFFRDSFGTARRIGVRFCTGYGASFAHILVKKIDRVRSGHGAMTS